MEWLGEKFNGAGVQEEQVVCHLPPHGGELDLKAASANRASAVSLILYVLVITLDGLTKENKAEL